MTTAPNFLSGFRKLLPLNVLHRRLKYRVLRDVLRTESATASVFDFKMRLPIQTPGIGRALMIFGERELDQYDILHRVLRPGDTVMDIGSNIGYYLSIECRAIGRDGYVYCFEPDIRNFALLAENIKLAKADHMVEIFNAPVTKGSAEVEFHLAEHSNLSSMQVTRGDENSVLKDRNMHNREYLRTVRLQSVDFGDFLAKARRPVDVIRMDIEGHEATVLTGLADRLEADPSFDRAPRAFVFEPHSWEYAEGNDLAQALRRLAAFGYRVTFLGTRREPNSPISRRGYQPLKTLKEKRGNLRGVFTGIDQAEAIELASAADGVTTVCLQRE